MEKQEGRGAQKPVDLESVRRTRRLATSFDVLNKLAAANSDLLGNLGAHPTSTYKDFMGENPKS